MPDASNSSKAASIALGAAIGLVLSLIGRFTGVIKPSYDMAKEENSDDDEYIKHPEPEFNDRLEILKELVFLAPVVIGAVVVLQITQIPSVTPKWAGFVELPVVSGLLGSLTG